jgi:hypothetical protein
MRQAIQPKQTLLSNFAQLAQWGHCVLPVFAIICFGILPNASAQTKVTTNAKPIDEAIYTTYNVGSDGTRVGWVVCGSTPTSEGCFDSGNLEPFGKVGAILEGFPSTDTATQTVTRAVYVLDIASGASKTAVALYVYTKTDVITSTFDYTTIVLDKAVGLPLIGGTGAIPSMAGNQGYLFIGTNKSPLAIQLDKKNLTFNQIGGFSPPINVSSITADVNGWVTVTFGSYNSTSNGFYIYGPNGSYQGDGGGSSFTVGAAQAVRPPTVK